MKHCPNPACPGLETFGIVSEYNDTASVCSECQTPLVDGPAPKIADLENHPAPEPDIELVSLVSLHEMADLALVESLLEQAEIPYLAKGEHIQDLFGMGRMVLINPIVGPVEIRVRADDLARAREVLADFVE